MQDHGSGPGAAGARAPGRELGGGMSQVGEAGSGGAGAGTLFRGGEGEARPDFVRRHPASPDFALPVEPTEEKFPRAPSLVTAGLVLLTAAAVLEGYRWLNVIPSS